MDGLGNTNAATPSLNIQYAISGMECRCSLQEHRFSIVWGIQAVARSAIFLSYLVAPGMTPIGVNQPIRENYAGSSYVLGITVSSTEVIMNIPNRLGNTGGGLNAIGIMVTETV